MVMPSGLVAADLLQNLVGSPASGEKCCNDNIRIDHNVHHEIFNP